MALLRTASCRFSGSLSDRIAVARAADRQRVVPGVYELDVEPRTGDRERRMW